MTLQYEQYPVSLFDADGSKIICRHVGVFLHVTEGETSGLLIIGNIDHGCFSGNLLRQLVNDIKGKIELVIVFELNVVYHAVLIHRGVHKFFVYRMH